nr:MAG TPA: hypothetical protein [Caudoviricetes sp.]DAU01624.1 MAG TPA: hypothetical protein [Caudoviricetes sp.]DAX21020.1 MAG TPA: hypothetical protein [Caudoviricetes sp.]
MWVTYYRFYTFILPIREGVFDSFLRFTKNVLISLYNRTG